MDIGDIYLVQLTEVERHEQVGQRPAIVMQKAEYELTLPTVLVIPFTSKSSALDFPGTLEIVPDHFNNLRIKSVALVFQLRAIDKRRLVHKIGRLRSTQVKKLHKLMKNLLGFEL